MSNSTINCYLYISYIRYVFLYLVSKLWEQKDFPDVTLVSADSRQMEAHRGILAASSPFFRNILLANPHPKPLLYLSNVDLARLTSILQFIYVGQVGG